MCNAGRVECLETSHELSRKGAELRLGDSLIGQLEQVLGQRAVAVLHHKHNQLRIILKRSQRVKRKT